MGYVQITSRVGAMISPWVSDWLGIVHDRLPYAAMGALAVMAALFLYFLPETKGEATAETYQEEESEVGQELSLVAEEALPASV